MPSDLIEMWALSVGAVLVHAQAWIAALAIVGLIWRLSAVMRARHTAIELFGVIAALDQISDKLDKVVVFPKNGGSA